MQLILQVSQTSAMLGRPSLSSPVWAECTPWLPWKNHVTISIIAFITLICNCLFTFLSPTYLCTTWEHRFYLIGLVSLVSSQVFIEWQEGRKWQHCHIIIVQGLDYNCRQFSKCLEGQKNPRCRFTWCSDHKLGNTLLTHLQKIWKPPANSYWVYMIPIIEAAWEENQELEDSSFALNLMSKN